MGGGLNDPTQFDSELGYPVFLNNVPLYHIAGIIGIYGIMANGGAMVLPDMFTPESFMQLVEREKVTLTYLVPTMFHMILEDPSFGKYDLTSLKSIGYGAMPMSDDLFKTNIEGIPQGISYADNFGCTECNATSIAKRPEDHEFDGTEEEVKKKLNRLKGVGKPLTFGIETQIVDENGEVAPPVRLVKSFAGETR